MPMVQINQDGNVKTREGGNGRIRMTLCFSAVAVMGVLIPTVQDLSEGHRYQQSPDGGLIQITEDGERHIPDENVLFSGDNFHVFQGDSTLFPFNVIPTIGLTEGILDEGRVVHDVDCAPNVEGGFSVFSGGQPVPNTTAVFNENRLPNAVPVATGSCDVTVTDEYGNEIDSYRVNAYQRGQVVYNF